MEIAVPSDSLGHGMWICGTSPAAQKVTDQACDIIGGPHLTGSSFDDPLSESRNARIERTLDSLQSLLTNTDKLRDRYGLKPHRQAQGPKQIEGLTLSAFARAFQNTRSFWNTSLQRTSKTAGSALWTVNDKERFSELIEALSKLIEDLEKFTEDLSISKVKTTIVEYEMQIIGDEGSLEAIAEASTSGEDDDIVSSAARRQLDRVKERTVLTQALLQPDDSASVVSPAEHGPATGKHEALENDETYVISPIGIQRVKDSEWRKVKPRQGILPWLSILLVSMTNATPLTRHDSLDADIGAVEQEPELLASQAPDGLLTVEPRATKLALNSKILLDAMHSITGAQILSTQNVLVYPFRILAQHDTALRAALEAAKKDCDARTAAEATKVISDTASADNADDDFGTGTFGAQRIAPTRLRDELACLVSFMDSDVPLGRPAGTAVETRVAFEHVRLMYQPGDILVDPKDNKCGQAFVLMQISGGRKILDPHNRSRAHLLEDGEKLIQPIEGQSELAFWTPVLLTCWYSDFNGIEIGPIGHVIVLQPFTGRRKIYQDHARPLKLCPERAVFEGQLLHRGQRFLEIIRIKHFSYFGRQLPEMSPRIGARGRDHSSICPYCAEVKTDQELAIECIIDHGTALTHLARLGYNHEFHFNGDWHQRTDLRETFEPIQCSDPLCTRCTDTWDDNHCDTEDWSRSKKRLGLLSRPITPEELIRSNLLEKTILPVSIRVIGYSLNQHVWLPLHIDGLNYIVNSGSPFDQLVLPPRLKKIIQASDEMRPKRDGAPRAFGTLKNSRNLRAHSLDRPLLSFSTAVLGSEAVNFERRLTMFLTLARKWQCVVCLEEADQLVAQKQRNDSALISSRFVQHLDAFSGVIIMITNRVGTFDESLRSRIHVPIYFPRLNKASSMEIWRMTIQNLPEQYPELTMDQR
ncbi:hypothetical protein LTR86_009768 [Recurvomyces mirabilis]|nr:hypothetical protein LTR86_009768 [Recurvomyces mirabilis]